MKRLADSRGATVVEFAIVVPLLLVLVFGIIDFARYFSVASSVNTASRESARYGSSVGDSPNAVPRFTDCDEIIAAGVGFGVVTDITAANYSITYDRGPATAVFQTCPAGGPNPDAAAFLPSDRIIVTVSREFQFITPFLGSVFGPVTVTSTDRRSFLSL